MSRTKKTTNVHHLYWPASAYKTALERTFRCLPCHQVEMGIVAHIKLHRYQRPPEKPPTWEMVEVIEEHEMGRCTCNVIGLESVRQKRRG